MQSFPTYRRHTHDAELAARPFHQGALSAALHHTPRASASQAGGWVAVIRYDLHMLLLNSLALKLAGIDRNTADVPGGVIERDANGEPTGIIKDAAKELVLRAIGTPGPDQIDATVERGIALALSKGVTQVHTTDLDTASFDAARRLRTKG